MTARIFFDTQVVSILAGDRSDFPERFWRSVTARYRYVVSPLTMFELFFGLAGASPEYFQVNQKQFQTLSRGNPTILPFPERFAIKRALGIDIGQDFHTPAECAQYIRLVLKARNKAEIEAGRVRVSPLDRKRGWGMNLADMADARKAVIRDHVDLLNRVRNREQPIPSATDWAKSILHKSGAPVTDDNATAFLDAANAVYHYDKWLWSQAPGKYRFEARNHEGDLMDSMQLYYLADPKMHFLTDDTRIKQRIARSRRAEQILLYKDIVTVA